MSETTALALIPAGPDFKPAYGQLGQLRRAVLQGVAAETSRRNYGLALDELSAFCEARGEPVLEHRVRSFAGRPAEISSRSNSSWGIPRFRRQKDTSDRSRRSQSL